MADPKLTCKTCQHYVNGTFDAYPNCGRAVDPVMGTPLRLCFVERLSGFDDVVAARKAAEMLDACGPDGRHYTLATEPRKESLRGAFIKIFK